MPASGRDQRLVAGIAASRRWYEMTFALHGKAFAQRDDIWVSLVEPPPFHSSAMTLRPSLDPGVVAAVAARPHDHSVSDTFADVALDQHGYQVFFEATWVHASKRGGRITRPPGWTVVDSVAALDAWSIAHDYVGVLPAGVLSLPEVDILARYDDGQMSAGAVVHATDSTVGLSNVWALTDDELDWAEVLAATWSLHPDADLVGYERGRDLTSALGAGFTGVGTHRVWASSATER